MRNVRALRAGRVLRSVPSLSHPAAPHRPITNFTYKTLCSKNDSDGSVTAMNILNFFLKFMQAEPFDIYRAVTSVIFREYPVNHVVNKTEYSPRFHAACNAIKQLEAATRRKDLNVRLYEATLNRSHDFLLEIAHHVETLAFYLGLLSDEELERIGFHRDEIPPTVTLQQPAAPQTSYPGHVRFNIVKGSAAA